MHTFIVTATAHALPHKCATYIYIIITYPRVFQPDSKCRREPV